MAHGNVYAADKIDAALANYFQAGNLTALRELALLWVADEVDVALQRYRTDKHITETWETRERVVVALTGGPESETVLRRGGPHRQAGRRGRAAGRARAARRRAGRRRRSAPSRRLRRLADDVGRQLPHRGRRRRARAALLDFARGVNATQLVLGTSRRSRLARVFDEGIGARVVQESGSDRRAHGHPRRGRPRRCGCPAAHGALDRSRQACSAGCWRCCCRPLATVIGVAAGDGDRAVHRRGAVLPGHGDRGRAGRRARAGAAGRGGSAGCC